MQRIRQLDGVRGLAILAVFAYHSIHIKFLWMGVDLFFILSGFLITGVLLDRKQETLRVFLGGFYARRTRRILAPYAIFLIVASCFIGIAWTRQWYFYLFLTNLLQPLHIPLPGAFVTLWSLAVEEQFYFLWPLAVYFLSPRRLRVLCILLIVMAPLLRGLFVFADDWPAFMLTPFRMDLLATGSLLCLLWRERRESVQRWGARLGIPLAIAGYAALRVLLHYGIAMNSNTRMSNVLIYEASLVACLGVMLFALGGKGIGWLKMHPLTYIGRVSYSMYLVHMGVILMVFSKLHGWLGVLGSFVLTVAYAATLWVLLEKRLLARQPSAPQSSLSRV
jgi:peptidoglycan/LPS O-acetylase OafA/YrhL